MTKYWSYYGDGQLVSAPQKLVGYWRMPPSFFVRLTPRLHRFVTVTVFTGKTRLTQTTKLNLVNQTMGALTQLMIKSSAVLLTIAFPAHLF